MTEKLPFFWARKIASHLQELDSQSHVGSFPPIDWHRISSTLAARLGAPDFSISQGNQSWRSTEELKEGLGDDILVLPLKVGPLNGSAFWMMSREGITKLTSWMLHGGPKTTFSESLTEGFYRFLLLQSLDALASIEPLQKLSIVLSESSPLPETSAFCVDVEIHFNNHSTFGRLAIEPELRRSYIEQHSHSLPEALLSSHAKSLELILGVNVGSILLNHDEWHNLNPGDFIPLDPGGYNPRKHTGAAYLQLGTTPVFQVKIKQNAIELIDRAAIYEEQMAETPNSPEQLPVDEGTAVTLKELPIHLTVELARLRITLEELTKLHPGKLIELPMHPERSVKLTVNGQLVGNAELVHLGEHLGIRIINLG